MRKPSISVRSCPNAVRHTRRLNLRRSTFQALPFARTARRNSWICGRSPPQLPLELASENMGRAGRKVKGPSRRRASSAKTRTGGGHRSLGPQARPAFRNGRDLRNHHHVDPQPEALVHPPPEVQVGAYVAGGVEGSHGGGGEVQRSFCSRGSRVRRRGNEARGGLASLPYAYYGYTALPLSRSALRA